MEEVKYITASEAGRILNRSAERARQYADNGALSVIRTSGGIRLFDKTEVVDLAKKIQHETSKRGK